MSPHQIEFLVKSSLTINLSIGDLPVNSPVFILIAPVDVLVASPFFKDISANSFEFKFQ